MKVLITGTDEYIGNVMAPFLIKLSHGKLFSTLKTECADRPFGKRAQARTTIFEYIEAWYNRQRLHPALDCLSWWSSNANRVIHCAHANGSSL
jgi:hypothetical protein